MVGRQQRRQRKARLRTMTMVMMTIQGQKGEQLKKAGEKQYLKGGMVECCPPGEQ